MTDRSTGANVRVGVAIPAAGSGRRMGGVRKPFLELLGEPVLVHALRPFLGEPRVVSVVVALSEDDAASPPEWLTGLDPRVTVVAGGATRSASVRRALAALPPDVDVIAVHDAARPLVQTATVTACVETALRGVGAVAGCPAVDTMKRVDAHRRIIDTPDRSTIWHAHTPQAFPAEMLRAAYETPLEGTDDASLAEAMGETIVMVDGGPANLKVTRPGDVALAEAILAARSS